MADFRRWLYALACMALLMGLIIPANAQTTPFQCSTNAGVTPTVRAEGYTEYVGDLLLICSGGQATTAGALVPRVNILVSLNTNITSKLLGNGFNEALMIIDEPNAPGPNSNRPILNCGNAGAPDTSISGPGVCEIVSNGNPAQTYDGTPNVVGLAGGTPAAPLQAVCGSVAAGAFTSGSFGCGRPNIFQAIQGTAQNVGQANIITFNGVPIDPPGTGGTRSIRITNVRADAEFLGVASSFSLQTITMSVSTNGSTSVGINVSSQIVAFVQHGLIVLNDGKGDTSISRLNFVQCNSELPKLFLGTASATLSSVLSGTASLGTANTQATGTATNPLANVATISFQEGFANAWKTKNIAFLLPTTNTPPGNGVLVGAGGAGYQYNNTTGPTNYPGDADQNVPGAIYNTESGFEYTSTATLLSPNPPLGISSTSVTGANNGGTALNSTNATSTGIQGAGIASAGTRLAVAFSGIPNGASVWVAPVLYLYRQGTAASSTALTGLTTGVAVLTSTDASGAGAFTAAATTANLVQISSTNLAVYEILFADPSSSEELDVPCIVSYQSNLSANPPAGLPVPNTITQVTGGFAPFYSTSAARQPSSTLPHPRFVPGTSPLNIFEITKCACNLLFPFVASTGGFDTGIAIANTSADPGAAAGFVSTGQQSGAVTFYYYGAGANGAAAPASQTSNVVMAGQVLTYVLSTGGGAIVGGGANGLNNSAAGFEGYIIAQTAFQYCHGFAFISALGGGPTSAGISEGYLGIVLDKLNPLPRTLQSSENDAH